MDLNNDHIKATRDVFKPVPIFMMDIFGKIVSS